MNSYTARTLARMASGLLSSFRKVPLRLLPEDIANTKFSFSQFGEDMLIAEHVVNQNFRPKGIYVDAGCFDPVQYSNTRLLNLLGWRGINIDVAPEVIDKFRLFRAEDHNVCAGLSDKESDMHLAGEVGLASRKLVGPGEQVSGPAIRTTTLANVLDESPFQNSPIDLLDIDCELHDLEVLRGFPFERNRPLIACVEAHTQSELDQLQNFFAELEYIKLGTRGPSHIFRDKHTVPTDLPSYVNMTEL